MNHTPGPWIYDERAGIVAVYAGDEKNCLDLPHDCFLFVRGFERKSEGWKVDGRIEVGAMELRLDGYCE